MEVKLDREKEIIIDTGRGKREGKKKPRGMKEIRTTERESKVIRTSNKFNA